MRNHWILGVGGACALLIAGSLAQAQGTPAPTKPTPSKPVQSESEREVKESAVPKAALDALKRHANNATLTEFAEEVEHGHTFYEGSYKGASGHVDVLVTDTGDLVEIEEAIAADKAPAVVQAEARKAAGKDARLRFEKKTMVLYEVHYKQGDEGHEIILTPDGRPVPEKGAKEAAKDKDEGA
jgi:hypothetical protein